MRTTNKLSASLLVLVLSTLGPGCGCSSDPGGDPDGGLVDGAGDSSLPPDAGDAAPPEGFAVLEIRPGAASRLVDTPLLIVGRDFLDGAEVVLTSCDTMAEYELQPIVVAADGRSLGTSLPMDPARELGVYTVTVFNPDGEVGSLECDFLVSADPPPTVTSVTPATAWRGIPNDGVLSDVVVTIRGTGFESTPGVRFAKAESDLTYDALFVGFVDETELTAVVPSETRAMEPGFYHVIVANPDMLEGVWRVPDGMGGTTEGRFEITTTPPPDIVSVTPHRVASGGCTSTVMTIAGTGFHDLAKAYYAVQPATACAGAIFDGSGTKLCPLLTLTTAQDEITARFSSCPGSGAWPVSVVNPDGQSDMFFAVMIANSSDGHLNDGPFETVAARLVTPRWKHGATFGFDAFGKAHLVVVGGQDGAGSVLGTTETSQLSIFGVPAPFSVAEQYGDATNPRVPNQLTTPRQGHALVRVGHDFFAIGGASTRTDTTTVVPALQTVERARMLSYDEKAPIKLPEKLGGAGLPRGAWYYQVAALGPWGEGLPSHEVVALGAEGRIKVCWDQPLASGATGYNVYRSRASDGRMGTAALLVTNINPGDKCFVDTGVGLHAPAPGRLRGLAAAGAGLAAGTHSYQIASVVDVGGQAHETLPGYRVNVVVSTADVADGKAAVQLSWNPVPNATYRLYKLDPGSGTFRRLDTGPLGGTTFLDVGTAFAEPVVSPRPLIRPLPPGSLSRWRTGTPDLLSAREGAEAVAVVMEPTMTSDLVARIIVAGGRTSNTLGDSAYLKTAESLGIKKDGTVEAAWSMETPVFTHARAYFSLVTTQDRDSTPFPPDPEEPPDDPIINKEAGGGSKVPSALYSVAGDEPVWLLAVHGDSSLDQTNNQGRKDFEACRVHATTGRLDCGATWWVQLTPTRQDNADTYGSVAVVIFGRLYTFLGVDKETIGASSSSRTFHSSQNSRFNFEADLDAIVDGQVIEQGRQAGGQKFNVLRTHFKMVRLLGYIYVIGGWGDTTPNAPTDRIERHLQ
jgi:hypothetical protein